MVACEGHDRSAARIHLAREGGDEQERCACVDGDMRVEALGRGVENAGLDLVRMTQHERGERPPLTVDPLDE